MNNTKTAEERIWLQSHDEDGDWYGGDGPTWCVDKINDTDIEYIRADVAKNNAAEARREALREAAELARSKYPEAVEHDGFDSGLRIAGTFIAKAIEQLDGIPERTDDIEQLGDSDHESCTEITQK